MKLLTALLLFVSQGFAKDNVIKNVGEEGFVNLSFPVKSYKIDNDKILIEVTGIYDSSEVSLTLIYPQKLMGGFCKKNGNLEMQKEAVKIGKIIVSDKNGPKLAKIFGKEYKMNVPGETYRDELTFSVINLSLKENDLLKDETKTKIFYDDKNERNEYFEMFINFDIPKKCIYLNEKDMDYRENVLKVLSTKIKNNKF